MLTIADLSIFRYYRVALDMSNIENYRIPPIYRQSYRQKYRLELSYCIELEQNLVQNMKTQFKNTNKCNQTRNVYILINFKVIYSTYQN